jgi:hypothetical protein
VTLSNLEKTNRRIRGATRQVYQRESALDLADGPEAPAPPNSEQIVAMIEEHIGWDFDQRERDLALFTWHEADLYAKKKS